MTRITLCADGTRWPRQLAKVAGKSPTDVRTAASVKPLENRLYLTGSMTLLELPRGARLRKGATRPGVLGTGAPKTSTPGVARSAP